MQFYILHIHREIHYPPPTPENPLPEQETSAKFFPVRNSQKTPLMVDAVTPETAWEIVRQRYPFICHNLAIQEKTAYDELIRRITPLRNTSRVHRPDAPRSPRAAQ